MNRIRQMGHRLVESVRPSATSETSAVAATNPAQGLPDETSGYDELGRLVTQMLREFRYALLLRPQIACCLDANQMLAARKALQQGMSPVPAGDVALGVLESNDAEGTHVRTHVVQVDGFYLDRCCVTNQEFAQFVRAGGYQQAAFWDADVWPSVVEFVDHTGQPGPRYWRDGTFASGNERHPVAGVSWYEAAAYARWVGKRLPTDAEWVKAGCWPVALPQQGRSQRRFPWGDTMNRLAANLWPAKTTAAVDSFSEGISVGGVYQLIGNVWEWTLDDYRAVRCDLGRDTQGDGTMKSLRGGAFDTYFDAQATCHFQSGDIPLSRKHNVGFRCALSQCDLQSDVDETSETVEETHDLMTENL